MTIHFYKYQGAGNDFVLLDNRNGQYNWLQTNHIQLLCHRRFGIGADGLMLLERHPELDFNMRYFNSDGPEGSMCGNGGRCIVAFAQKLGMLEQNTRFNAVDGLHEASIDIDGQVRLGMIPVQGIAMDGADFVLNTGSPHYVQFADNLDLVPIFEQGRAIRYSPAYAAQGINVNFVQVLSPDSLRVYTYERGVEEETLSCGTGVTASALCYAEQLGLNSGTISIQTKGGDLKVSFERKAPQHFDNIVLEGPAVCVFEGTFVVRS